jgi:hypothetical protein
MDTAKYRSTAAEYLSTAAVIVILAAIYLGWRSLLGQDNALLGLLQRLF